MAIIFLDESGYTVRNLLDSAQPTFTLATIKCSELEAQNFKTRFFNEVQAAELHYSKMKKRPRQQSMIIKFLKELLNNPGLVKVKIVHKRYALYYRLIDTIVEPAANKDGINFYQDGRIIDLTNTFYYDFPTAAGTDYADNLLRQFQEMMDKLDLPSFNRFFLPILNDKYKQPYEVMIQSINEHPLDFFLWHLQKGYDSLGFELVKQAIATFRPLKAHPLDLGLVSAFHLTALWRSDITEPISLIHDKSSKMATSEHIWNTLVDPDVSPKTIHIGYGDLTITFPIGVKTTRLEDSRDWIGLQLADILAGAANQWAKWIHDGRKLNDDDDLFSKRLDEIIPAFPMMAFWPSPEIHPESRRTIYDKSVPGPDYITHILEKYYLEYYAKEAERMETIRKLREAGCEFIYRVY